MTGNPLFTLVDVLAILPHRPPFLFVDEVLKLDPGKLIVAERRLRPDEPQFVGHFPGRAIMPGVLVTEALAQTSGLLLGLTERLASNRSPVCPRMFYLTANTMKYTHPAAPGDVLRLRAESDKQFSGLYRFRVEATAGRHLVGSGSITLALADTLP